VAAPKRTASREESGLHHGEEHHEVAPAIPAADRDFRGLLGDLERAVKPYLAPDGKPYAKDADQTIPFYQIVTWADPHFIPGYTIGAMAICRGGKHPDRAIAFLEEGLLRNPGSFEIRTELGRYHLVHRRDFRAAEAHLLEALRLVARRAEFSEEEQETLTDCYRWLALCHREGGHPARAVQTALLGLSRIGPDVTLQHTLRFRGRTTRK
jgi:hypothetical protein